MDIFSAILVYILAWWMVLFCVLPLNIQSIAKSDKGFMPGAPIDPQLQKKLVLTTMIAAVVWLVIFAVVKSDMISFHDIAQRMEM